jgi:plastocyanin
MQMKHAVMAGVALLAAAGAAYAGPSGGTVSGKVTYEGTPANMKPIDMSMEASCAKMYATPQLAETVVTGAGNSLENVVVYISAGAPDDAAPSNAATFTQKGCRYIPHLLAFQVNQELKITNEDQTTHNVHPQPKRNREWNKSQPPGAPPIRESYDQAEFFSVKCNVHPWMHGTFAVMPNSHYAVTGAGGSFSLANLPPGKYTITAWHEAYGEQSQDVTIRASETKTINFVFKSKPN